MLAIKENTRANLVKYLHLSISLTAVFILLESLSLEGIMDDIDLTRDTAKKKTFQADLLILLKLGSRADTPPNKTEL